MDQPVADFDLFYSQYHQTFLMVYLTRHSDNTFYYRSLQTPEPIVLPYPTDASQAALADEMNSTSSLSSDYVESILHQPWSEERVLYKAATPPFGNYIYAAGVHTGYFGADDVTRGGKKLLLSWTEHTGEDAASPRSGYSHVTASVEFE
jgi:hypothetical protein